MAKFIALYCMPVAGLEEWMKLPEAERKAQDEAMKADWNKWMAEHKSKLVQTSGVGKTKRVTKDGTADAKNDVMLYSVVEADTHEEAAAMFAGHPHMAIPGAWIDVSTSNQLSDLM